MTTSFPHAASVQDFLPGTGGMSERIRQKDWSTTPLGPPEKWPLSLKTAVRIMLTSRYAMWMLWGPELTFLCNDAYLPTLGVKQEWALGSRSDVVWREIWPEIGPRIDTVLKSNTATYDENLLLFLERSGYPEETYHTFSYSPLANDDGVVVGMLCVVTEETIKVIGERRLTLLGTLATKLTGILEETALFRVVESVCGGNRDTPTTSIFLADGDQDPSLQLALPNPTAFSREIELFLHDYRQPQRGSEAINIPPAIANLAPRGPWEKAPVELVTVPFFEGGSTIPAGYLVAGLNPFRRLDDAYGQFLELLAGQIGACLTNARVHRAEHQRAEALAEIDRAKTVFFSNVSHEFRTPLTLMLTPLEEVLGKTNLPADNRELLEIAHRNSVRLLKLVNSLLDFSRIEAGRIQAIYEPADLAAATADLASNFRSAVEKAGLELIVDASDLHEPVYIDRDMWEKIVLNLLSNAFKFTFDGQIKVSVRASPDSKNALVAVSDTGIGISSDDLPELFQRFRRVEGARSRSYEGSGIGLALVQELVKLHGGDIHVESTVGKGTTFTVAIPFGYSHLPQDKVAIARTREIGAHRPQAYVDEVMTWLDDGSSPESPPATANDPEDITPIPGAPDSLILLADDNSDMRHYIRRLLSAAGFRIEAVANGQDALDAAARIKPDLILSDVMMPRLDGFGLVAALKKRPELSEIPVLLLSARAGDDARVEGLRAGADDYLTKPFTAAELIARVDVQIKLAKVRRDSRQVLKDEAAVLQALTKVGNAVAAESDLERMVQVVTDAATQLSGAQFGAFFYNVLNSDGESYLLYTLSGASREAFSKFPQPRATAVFAPTFRGEGIVRSDDITKDPRFGKNAPYHGHPKGHLPVVSYLAVPVITQSGEVAGGLFFGHQETGVFGERAERVVAGIATQAGIAIDKARMIQRLRENEQTLERKVVERTAELSEANENLQKEAAERERVEEALRHVQKMESIGQLTGGVAHDFNNLLTIIIGSIEALHRQLQQGMSASVIGQSADNAMRGAKRAAALTQRLLAFARRQPLDPKPLDAARLVISMSDLLRRSLGEQISLQAVSGAGLWPVMVDPNQLEVAILNLAVNARDAMPNGGRLTIETANAFLDEGYASTQVEVVPGQYVMIAVTDNGSGMAPEVVHKAFEPFFTTKDIGQGTGLGLSQVYGFVKQSGGHVKIYSEVGEGTTVKLYLPRLLSAQATEEVDASANAVPPAHSETILVVEDDDDVRAYTISILTELGYSILVAPDGQSAVKLLNDNPQIDLLFTDVGLPGGMTGRDLADKTRTIRPDLKILFTTGYARNAIVHDGRLDPGVQLITKPFTFSDVAKKIRAVLDGGQREGRILVIEDEEMIQLFTAEMLQDAGLTADPARTATEALNKLRLRPDAFDGVILDFGLPDRRGEDVLDEIRALASNLPIVIASGKAHPTAGGATDQKIATLIKPYSQEQFYKALRSVGITLRVESSDLAT